MAGSEAGWGVGGNVCMWVEKSLLISSDVSYLFADLLHSINKRWTLYIIDIDDLNPSIPEVSAKMPNSFIPDRNDRGHKLYEK